MKDSGSSYGQGFASSDIPSQNICHNPDKYSKLGEDLKNVISNFAWSMTAVINV